MSKTVKLICRKCFDNFEHPAEQYDPDTQTWPYNCPNCRMTTRLYHHKTDGGAEYLCTAPIEGTDEGDLYSAIVRLDGEPELLSAAHAAAPELLSALQALVNLHDFKGDDTRPYYELIQNARAALAKAKG